MKNLYKKNKLIQMAGFCASYEEGSISAAAVKLNTAQSNVSLQVSTLEKEMGLELFRRTKNKLTPTVEGKRVYTIAKKLLLNFEDLFTDTFNTIKDDFNNVINLAGHPFMLSHVLPKYCTEMKRQNPKVSFDLWNIESSEALDMLITGNLDMAFFPYHLNDLAKDVEAIPFYKSTFHIVMHKSHPLAQINSEQITWKVIANYDYINLGKKVTAQGLKDIIENYRIETSFRLHGGTWEICAGFINQGSAISGADVRYIKSFNYDFILKDCSHLMPNYVFFLLRHKSKQISTSAKNFIKLIQKNPTETFLG